MDAMYATWTGDPALAPWTNDVHLDIGLLSFNYFFAVFITTICVAGRLYVRKTYLRRLHLDDWLLLGAWVCLSPCFDLMMDADHVCSSLISCTPGS